MKKALCAALLLACSGMAAAETVESAALNETWLNGGFYTYHFKRDIDLNDKNPGWGLEQRITTVTALAVGQFKNSDWGHTTYVAAYYQPWRIGPIRLGAVGGLFNGYPKVRDGGWFPSLIPVASYEYQRIGISATVVPPFKERLRAGISVQLRVKIN